MQNIEAFGISRHNAVFDAIVDHLHEVTGATRSTVQITMFCRRWPFFAIGRANCRCHRWCKRSEDRIKPPHDLFLASDHQAIATSEAPGTAAGADVDVMDAFRFQCHGAIEVMAVMWSFALVCYCLRGGNGV